MKVEKVPDSTYDMIGGLDQQIKEIKEVCHLALCAGRAPPDIAAHQTSCCSHSLIHLRPAMQVIELPIKHPELFEALGVAQPKVRPQACS